VAAKKTYSDKLKDPRWQKKRLEVLNRDKFVCQCCYDDSSTLHVHHLKYNNCDPWDIESNYLITLCEDCHIVEEEEYKKSIEDLIDTLKRRGFITTDFIRLRDNLIDLPYGWQKHDPNLDVIGFILSTPNLFKHCYDLYFDHLDKKSQIREKKKKATVKMPNLKDLKKTTRKKEVNASDLTIEEKQTIWKWMQVNNPNPEDLNFYIKGLYPNSSKELCSKLFLSCSYNYDTFLAGGYNG
jgi:hypothetical protein